MSPADSADLCRKLIRNLSPADGAELKSRKLSVVLKKELYFCYNNKYMVSKELILSEIKQQRKKLQNHGIARIGLFGSYAREEQTEKSDIDILIEFEPEKENFDNYMTVYDLLENLFSNKKVEVVTKNGLSPYIGPKILKEVIYA